MRGRTVIAIGAIVCVVTLVLTSILISALRSEVTGFSSSELRAPMITYAQEIVPDQHTHVSRGPGFSPELNWSIAPVFAGFGGALRLNMTNHGDVTAYISAFGLSWVGGKDYWRNCSVYITEGQNVSMGLLFFGAPEEAGVHHYTLIFRVETQVAADAWRDLGVLSTSSRSAEVLADDGNAAYSYGHNIRAYYNKLNGLVSYSQAAPLADIARSSAPGPYSLEQVLDAFDWIMANIAYVSDPEDRWQSPQTTLSSRSGDCEDQAILLASTIGNLGGNGRVNLIDGHAFATVFIGPSSMMANVTRSVQLHYGADVSVLFLSDATGLWLIIDTLGMPYAGGLPALAAPSSEWSTGQWGPTQGDFLYALDATGRTSGWLPF